MGNKRGPVPDPKNKVALECLVCRKSFTVWKNEYAHRIKMKRKNGYTGDQLACSKVCARSVRGHVRGPKIKHRWYESEEQHHWEQILSDLGLGMHVGKRAWIEYGFNPALSG